MESTLYQQSHAGENQVSELMKKRLAEKLVAVRLCENESLQQLCVGRTVQVLMYWPYP